MSPHQIIAVAVRLFAIWLFSGLAVYAPFYFWIDPGTGDVNSALALIVGGVIVLFLALGLWRFPLTVANKLLSSTVQERPDKEGADLWLAMGCALMGLWFLTTAISGLLASIMQTSSEFGGGYLNMSTWPGVYLPKMIIGLWLVLGGKGFRKLFWWVRNAGHTSPPEIDADDTSD